MSNGIPLDRYCLYLDLINKYGSIQMIIGIEEMSELQKEICKALRFNANIEHLIEEIADVKIMLEQISVYFGIKRIDIDKVVSTKIERTKKLLKGE